MDVQANPVRVENDHEQTRVLINQLDQDASILRNRSQISPKTRARINALMAESRQLARSLRAQAPCGTVDLSQIDTEQQRFNRGHALYLKHQAPAFSHAHKALQCLIPCTLPPRLEREIITLMANLDRHCAHMRTYTPSQGVPSAMERLLTVHLD